MSLPRTLLVLVVGGACALAGCNCSSRPQTPRPPVIELPRGVGTTLARGLVALKVADDDVLKRIDPNQPSSHVQVWAEFKQAPSLKMVNAPGGLTAELDKFVAGLSGDRIAPLEVDTVLCGTGPNGTPLPRRPDGTWEPPTFTITIPDLIRKDANANGFSSATVHLNRLKATLAQLRLTASTDPANPTVPIPNVARLQLSLRDVQATIDEDIADATGYSTNPGEHVIEITNLDVDCDLTPSAGVPNAAGCSELPLRCLPRMGSSQVVQVQGIAGMLAGISLPAIGWWLQQELDNRLTAGALLHFEGYSSTGLTISPTALLTVGLDGGASTSCSWIPPDPPSEPAPLRGVARFRPELGHGELVSKSGNVKPYHLVPEVKVDWVENQNATYPLLPWRTIYGWDVRGGELSRSMPAGNGPGPLPHPPAAMEMAVSVEVVRTIPNPCWQTPMTMNQILEPAMIEPFGAQPSASPSCPSCLPEGAFLELSYGGDSLFSRELPSREVLDTVVPIGRKEFSLDQIAPMLEREFGVQVCPGPDCPSECKDSCPTWDRYTLVPSGGFVPENGIPLPHQIELWVRHELPVPEGLRFFDDPRTCLYEDDVDDRRFKDPSVVIARLQVDSAEFQSAPRSVPNLDGTGTPMETGLIPARELSPQAMRSLVSDPEGPQSLQISLTGCTAHGAGTHLPSPCWRGVFKLPQPGTVTVTGVSGTTAPRFALAPSVFAPNGGSGVSWLLGRGLWAAHGTFDRSGLRFHTKVPEIYRTLGVTTKDEDHRELSLTGVLTPWNEASYFDWAHDSTFLPPSTSPSNPHLNPANSRWRGPSFTWFADWTSDELITRWWGDVPPSFCLDHRDRFASPRSVTISGARLDNARTLSATQVLTGTVGPSGFLEVSDRVGGSAEGRLRVLLP